MKVIRDNHKPAPEPKPRRWTCAECDSVIEIARNEMGPCRSDRDGSFHAWKCPLCGHDNYVDARIVGRVK